MPSKPVTLQHLLSRMFASPCTGERDLYSAPIVKVCRQYTASLFRHVLCFSHHQQNLELAVQSYVSLQGLPTDDLSVQNGIMVTRATRYPVLVDPQGQGRTWIMHREEANQLKVTQLNDKLFRNHLEV